MCVCVPKGSHVGTPFLNYFYASRHQINYNNDVMKYIVKHVYISELFMYYNNNKI